MIGFTVIVHVHGHVPAHLSARYVARQKQPLTNRFTPLRRPPFLIVRFLQFLGFSDVTARKVRRPFARIRAQRTDKPERPHRRIALGKAHTGGRIALPFQFQMEQHHKLPCFRIAYHLGTLHDTAPFYVVPGLLGNSQSHSFVFPIHQVGRRIDLYAHFGGKPACRPVLAIPIILTFMEQQAAPVGIDVLPFPVRPFLPRSNTFQRLGTYRCRHHKSPYTKNQNSL